MRSKQEENIHNALCDYLRLQYPHVVFTSDASGVFVGMNRAKIMSRQRSADKIPDLLIFEPRGKWRGLFIEIKVDRSKVFKKNGEFKKDEHVMGQYQTLCKLDAKGYFATFGFGVDHCISIIDDYMNLKLEI